MNGSAYVKNKIKSDYRNKKMYEKNTLNIVLLPLPDIFNDGAECTGFTYKLPPMLRRHEQENKPKQTFGLDRLYDDSTLPTAIFKK